MVIRNRLFALLFRFASFAALTPFLVGYCNELGGALENIARFDIWASYGFIIVLGLEILFNLLDLRKGIHGVAAHFYAPIFLAIVCYNVLASAVFLVYSWPTGTEVVSFYSIGFHFLFLLLPLLEWLGFVNKGTVRWYGGFISMVVPVFYVIFAYFRTFIWPSVSAYGNNMYAYSFLNPKLADYPLSLTLFLASYFAITTLMIFLNNLAAGKYQRGIRDAY